MERNIHQVCKEAALPHKVCGAITLTGPQRPVMLQVLLQQIGLPPPERSDSLRENLSFRVIPASRSHRRHFQPPLCSLLLDNNGVFVPLTSQLFSSFIGVLKHILLLVLDTRQEAPAETRLACGWSSVHRIY